jgi:phosphomannomutase
MKQYLLDNAPARIANEEVSEISTIDGVKYILADDSWLLIRPSGTEPVLRVYAEGRSQDMVKEMIGYGEQIAASVT